MRAARFTEFQLVALRRATFRAKHSVLLSGICFRIRQFRALCSLFCVAADTLRNFALLPSPETLEVFSKRSAGHLLIKSFMFRSRSKAASNPRQQSTNFMESGTLH